MAERGKNGNSRVSFRKFVCVLSDLRTNLRSDKDTSNFMILVCFMNAKFPKSLPHNCGNFAFSTLDD